MGQNAAKPLRAQPARAGTGEQPGASRATAGSAQACPKGGEIADHRKRHGEIRGEVPGAFMVAGQHGVDPRRRIAAAKGADRNREVQGVIGNGDRRRQTLAGGRGGACDWGCMNLPIRPLLQCGAPSG